MSSILKALRRLEEERARKSPVAPEIAASLLRRGTRRQPATFWIWPTVLTTVVAVAAALLWSWRPASVTSPAVTSAASSTTIPQTAAGRGGAVIIEEVIDQRRPVLLPSKTPPVPAPKLLSAKVDPPRQRVKSGDPTPARERHHPVISAIVWQDDSSARMAVVDGLPVMTGELVGTAKVQEILRDRILFAEAEELFTVFIDPQ